MTLTCIELMLTVRCIFVGGSRRFVALFICVGYVLLVRECMHVRMLLKVWLSFLTLALLFRVMLLPFLL